MQAVCSEIRRVSRVRIRRMIINRVRISRVRISKVRISQSENQQSGNCRWDRTKLPKPECSNAAQCRLLNTEHELNVASTLERMNSPGVPDAYDRAVTKSLGWLHAHDQVT